MQGEDGHLQEHRPRNFPLIPSKEQTQDTLILDFWSLEL